MLEVATLQFGEDVRDIPGLLAAVLAKDVLEVTVNLASGSMRVVWNNPDPGSPLISTHKDSLTDVIARVSVTALDVSDDTLLTLSCIDRVLAAAFIAASMNKLPIRLLVPNTSTFSSIAAACQIRERELFRCRHDDGADNKSFWFMGIPVTVSPELEETKIALMLLSTVKSTELADATEAISIPLD